MTMSETKVKRIAKNYDKVIGMIEDEELMKFHMDDWGFGISVDHDPKSDADCGTFGCIGGFTEAALWVQGRLPQNPQRREGAVNRALGLSHDAAQQLFFSRGMKLRGDKRAAIKVLKALKQKFLRRKSELTVAQVNNTLNEVLPTVWEADAEA